MWTLKFKSLFLISFLLSFYTVLGAPQYEEGENVEEVHYSTNSVGENSFNVEAWGTQSGVGNSYGPCPYDNCNSQPQCPVGFRFENNQCVPIVRCPSGYYLRDNLCYPKTSPVRCGQSCEQGYSLVNNVCNPPCTASSNCAAKPPVTTCSLPAPQPYIRQRIVRPAEVRCPFNNCQTGCTGNCQTGCTGNCGTGCTGNCQYPTGSGPVMVY